MTRIHIDYLIYLHFVYLYYLTTRGIGMELKISRRILEDSSALK
jgi:hypothetical protein